MKNREANLLWIKRNGQVCYLHGLLNDELDPYQRRITIEENETKENWVFAMDELEPYQLFVDHTDMLVYSEHLILENTSFFQIVVPWTSEEEDLNNRLKNYLNEYKLLSKIYIIKYE